MTINTEQKGDEPLIHHDVLAAYPDGEMSFVSEDELAFRTGNCITILSVTKKTFRVIAVPCGTNTRIVGKLDPDMFGTLDCWCIGAGFIVMGVHRDERPSLVVLNSVTGCALFAIEIPPDLPTESVRASDLIGFSHVALSRDGLRLIAVAGTRRSLGGAVAAMLWDMTTRKLLAVSSTELSMALDTLLLSTPSGGISTGDDDGAAENDSNDKSNKSDSNDSNDGSYGNYGSDGNDDSDPVKWVSFSPRTSRQFAIALCDRVLLYNVEIPFDLITLDVSTIVLDSEPPIASKSVDTSEPTKLSEFTASGRRLVSFMWSPSHALFAGTNFGELLSVQVDFDPVHVHNRHQNTDEKHAHDDNTSHRNIISAQFPSNHHQHHQNHQNHRRHHHRREKTAVKTGSVLHVVWRGKAPKDEQNRSDRNAIVSLSLTQRHVLIGWSGGALQWLDTTKWSIMHSMRDSDNSSPTCVVFSPSFTSFAVMAESGSLKLVRVVEGVNVLADVRKSQEHVFFQTVPLGSFPPANKAQLPSAYGVHRLNVSVLDEQKCGNAPDAVQTADVPPQDLPHFVTFNGALRRLYIWSLPVHRTGHQKRLICTYSFADTSANVKARSQHSSITCMACSPCGNIIACGFSSGVVCILDATRIAKISASSPSEEVASSSGSHSGVLRVVWSRRLHDDPVVDIKFADNRRYFVSLGADDRAFLVLTSSSSGLFRAHGAVRDLPRVLSRRTAQPSHEMFTVVGYGVLPGKSKGALCCAWNRTGQWVYIGTRSGHLVSLHVARDRTLHQVFGSADRDNLMIPNEYSRMKSNRVCTSSVVSLIMHVSKCSASEKILALCADRALRCVTMDSNIIRVLWTQHEFHNKISSTSALAMAGEGNLLVCAGADGSVSTHVLVDDHDRNSLYSVVSVSLDTTSAVRSSISGTTKRQRLHPCLRLPLFGSASDGSGCSIAVDLTGRFSVIAGRDGGMFCLDFLGSVGNAGNAGNAGNESFNKSLGSMPAVVRTDDLVALNDVPMALDSAPTVERAHSDLLATSLFPDAGNRPGMRHIPPSSSTVTRRLHVLRQKFGAFKKRNSCAPSEEQLPRNEVAIDVDLMTTLSRACDGRAEQLRKQRIRENVSRQLLAERIKHECWGSQEAQTVTVSSIKRKTKVSNFALARHTAKLTQQRRHVAFLRAMELTERKYHALTLSSSMRFVDVDKRFHPNALTGHAKYIHSGCITESGLVRSSASASSSSATATAATSVSAAVSVLHASVHRKSRQLHPPQQKPQHEQAHAQAHLKHSKNEGKKIHGVVVTSITLPSPGAIASAQSGSRSPRSLDENGATDLLLHAPSNGLSASGPTSGSKLFGGDVNDMDSQQALMHKLRLFTAMLPLDGTSPLMYHPLECITRVRKLTQVHQLSIKCRRWKTRFNEEVSSFLTHKRREVSRINAKADECAQICLELGLSRPSLHVTEFEGEDPQSVFDIDESELQAPRVMSREEKEREECLQRDKKSRECDNDAQAQLRALDDFMGGTLYNRRERPIWEEEIARESWMDTVSASEMTDDQRRQLVAFEKKIQKMETERAMHRKLLETSRNKLLSEIKESVRSLDTQVAALASKRVSLLRQIYQQELMMCKLINSVQQICTDQYRIRTMTQHIARLEKQCDNVVQESAVLRARIAATEEEFQRASDEERALERHAKAYLYEFGVPLADYLWRLFRSRHNLYDGKTLKRIRTGRRTSHIRRVSLTPSIASGTHRSHVSMENVSTSERFGNTARHGGGGHSRRPSGGSVTDDRSVVSMQSGRSPNDSSPGISSRRLPSHRSKGSQKHSRSNSLAVEHSDSDDSGGTRLPTLFDSLDPTVGIDMRADEELDDDYRVVTGSVITSEDRQRDDDALPRRPLEISENVWDVFVRMRCEQIDKELEVDRARVLLDRMQRHYQFVEEQQIHLSAELRIAAQQLDDFRERRHLMALDTYVTVWVLQGQLELEDLPVVTDMSVCAMIDTEQVQRLNTLVLLYGHENIRIMRDIAKVRSNITMKKWRQKMLILDYRDAVDLTTELQLLRVTKNLQMLIKAGGHSQQTAHELRRLERKIEFVRNSGREKVLGKKLGLVKVRKMIKLEARENAWLQESVRALEVSVNERAAIHKLKETQRGEGYSSLRERRMTRIVQRSRLVELAKTQTEEIAALENEVERLRRRTFASFPPPGKRQRWQHHSESRRMLPRTLKPHRYASRNARRSLERSFSVTSFRSYASSAAASPELSTRSIRYSQSQKVIPRRRDSRRSSASSVKSIKSVKSVADARTGVVSRRAPHISRRRVHQGDD